MKTGTKVRVVTPVIEGVIVERKIVDDEVECKLEWQEGGETVHRWFAEGQLQAVEPAAPAAGGSQ